MKIRMSQPKLRHPDFWYKTGFKSQKFDLEPRYHVLLWIITR